MRARGRCDSDEWMTSRQDGCKRALCCSRDFVTRAAVQKSPDDAIWTPANFTMRLDPNGDASTFPKRTCLPHIAGTPDGTLLSPRMHSKVVANGTCVSRFGMVLGR